MYICNCKGVNEKSVKVAINAGVSSLGELREKTSLGSCCGKCLNHAKQILQIETPKMAMCANNI